MQVPEGERREERGDSSLKRKMLVFWPEMVCSSS